MSYQLQGSEIEDKNIIIYSIIIAVIFVCFVLPTLEKKFNEEQNEIREKMESLRGGKIIKLDTNKCSRECCLHTQWPAPHMPKKKSDKYISTNFMCNNGGCLCVSKEDKAFLSKRGNNYMGCAKKK